MTIVAAKLIVSEVFWDPGSAHPVSLYLYSFLTENLTRDQNFLGPKKKRFFWFFWHKNFDIFVKISSHNFTTDKCNITGAKGKSVCCLMNLLLLSQLNAKSDFALSWNTFDWSTAGSFPSPIMSSNWLNVCVCAIQTEWLPLCTGHSYHAVTTTQLFSYSSYCNYIQYWQ